MTTSTVFPMNPALLRLLPFLRWFPLKAETLKLDFIAGLTVALVLIPQSMAYAQLAGMPAYYGLYAAFLPVAVAAMWGSSNQLGTGPVAVVALLTASSLSVFAAPGSPDFIALAILLAFLVGVIQFTLGVFKLGVVVNFLSHPVIVGFTNAAAIIIALSQVSKLFGVPMGRSDHFLVDMWGVVKQLGDIHLPTLLMGLAAIAIMWAVKKYRPKWPGVLIAVVITTVVSWAIGFEKNVDGKLKDVKDPELYALVQAVDAGVRRLDELNKAAAAKQEALEAAHKADADQAQLLRMEADVGLARLAAKQAEEQLNEIKARLRHIPVVRAVDEAGNTAGIYPEGRVPQGLKIDDTHYRIRKVSGGKFKLVGGGEVVGKIPEGLPSFSLPQLDLDKVRALLSTALVIALVAFMEAISIAKAMAAKTRQRLDPNQELIGQGLANLVGSLSQSFPVSGSFSRSAVNLNAGAVTGMSSVFTALIVLLTLLLLTPLLYHLPQAVRAAIIIAAVVGLLNFAAIKHAWQANRHDGIAAVVTFVATLALAPHLDIGVLVGAGLAIVLFLLRTMKPRVAILGRHPDGALRDARVHGLPTSPHVTVLRFDGRLYFANVAYFEDAVLEAVAANPRAGHVLIVGDGINEIDASGEEVVRHLVERLRASGMRTVFAGLKKQVVDVLRATGALATIGEENIYPTADAALAAIRRELEGRGIDTRGCPLLAAPARAESAQPV
ncbi:MAG: SulP family inorganic anion transporter [Thiobacillaceae bacterium]|nr:SulP family inorganic anion transporter [Thiobacillaceae bacterium]